MKKKMRIHPLLVVGIVLVFLIGIKRPFGIYSLGQDFVVTEQKWEATGKLHEYTAPTTGTYGVEPSEPWGYWTFLGNPIIHPYWPTWEAGEWKKYTECRAEVTVCGRTTETSCSFDSATQIRVGIMRVDWCEWHEGNVYTWQGHVLATRQVSTTTQQPPPIDETTIRGWLTNLWNSVMSWLRGLFSWLT